MATAAQTRQLKKRFLKHFRQHGNVYRATEDAHVPRSDIYYWREIDAAFAAEFAEAEKEAVEHLEAEAHRRAVEGVEEPVFQGGKEVGRIRKFSDTLLIFILKARDPKYRDRQEISGPKGGAITLTFDRADLADGITDD
jgi:hypothetical protein